MTVAQPAPKPRRQDATTALAVPVPPSSPAAHAFPEVPQSPAGHFRLYFYAAVFYLANFLYQQRSGEQHGLARTLESFPFLGRYLRELKEYLPENSTWSQSIRWWERELEAWEQGFEGELPLCRAFAERSDRIALLLIGIVEEDACFGALFAALDERHGLRRPTLDLVESVIAEAGGARGACSRLIEQGAVLTVDSDQPRSHWELRVPIPVWTAVRGETPSTGAEGFRFWPLEELPDAADVAIYGLTDELANLSGLCRERRARGLIVRGSPGSDRFRVMAAAARTLGANLLDIGAESLKAAAETPWLGALATLTASLPVFQVDALPGETHTLPRIKGYAGPIGVVSGMFGGIALAASDSSDSGAVGDHVSPAVTMTLPPLDPEGRELLWQAVLGEQAPDDLRSIAQRFRLPPGYIRRAATLAVAYASVSGRDRVTAGDIRAAVGQIGREALDTLAVRLDPGASWNDLVVSPIVSTRLHEVYARCRHRERLSDALGQAFRSQPARGVKALLSGPSGTGKTLAAKVLATELGMDLYQIDLSAIVSKFVGETEKNLHRALTAAEELDVIIMLDEGDSLLARRSEVRGANDRYANLETNFLLQRLEVYQGIVLITTNAAENIDPAFQRRMDVVVQFSSPQPKERLLIWELHLPKDHAVDPDFLRQAALCCALTGGQIRSAAQHAALLALEEDGPIRSEHLEAAIYSEYRKAGALCPLDDEGVRQIDKRGGQTAFWRAVSAGGRSDGSRVR